MSLDTPRFVHDPPAAAMHYGRGCVDDLGDVLAGFDAERAVVVTGTSVGANRETMAPVRAGLGDRLAAVFDETTPEKRVETAYDGAEVVDEVDADAIVVVGAGSSHDLAKTITVLHADPRPPSALLAEYEAEGTMAVPSGLLPLVSVPTTFAGADVSTIGGASVPTGDGGRAEVGAIDPALMPEAVMADPELFSTTPRDALAGSAMNGFDKAIESVYSRHANPLVDATAVRAMRYLRGSLVGAVRGDDPAAMDRAVVGVLLAQQGITAPGAFKANVVHAFGHGLRRVWGVQQGVAHSVMAPHVLRLLFDSVDGRRRLLAEGLLGSDAPAEDDAAAEAVVEAVTAVRDGLGTPTRIRDLDGTEEGDVPEVAVRIHGDRFLARGPPGFEPGVEAIEAALRAAW